MNLLPKPASGTRPRVACEIMPQGVVAGRSSDVSGPLAAVARVQLAAGAVSPGLKSGNVVDRVAVSAAVRKVLESLGLKPNSRGADITLVVPDGAVRVLLLEFDSLSNKLAEALPIVRFRLKKLLPFDADDAMVSYQIMSAGKQLVRVLAVAIPRDVLSEYETAVREAGFEPGAVLPSTLASLSVLKDEGASLLVNANSLGVTTAIVRNGILLLHRSVDLQPPAAGVPANVPPAMMEPSAVQVLPIVDPHETAGEWAAQEPMPEHGRNPYADSPYTSPTLTADLNAELHHAILTAPTSIGTLTEDASGHDIPGVAYRVPTPPPVSGHSFGLEASEGDLLEEEITQAVSVAAAYFEDTLAEAPSKILSAGPLSADRLGRILERTGIAEADGLRVRELVESEDLLSDAVTASVPRSWLAGVLGALRG